MDGTSNRYERDGEWKSTALELGVLGGIGMGVGATLLRGNASAAAQGGGKAVKRVAQNVDRYLERSVFKRNPLGRFVYKSLKKVPGQSSKLKRSLGDAGMDVGTGQIAIERSVIERRVAKERQEAVMRELAQAHMEGRDARPAEELFDTTLARKRREAEAGAAWRDGKTSPYLAGEAPRADATPSNDKKKSLFDEGVGAAVAGLGFGAGLTAFHALDRRLSGQDPKKERSYEAAGSLIGGEDMQKRAGSAGDVYKGVGEFGKKIPNAVANGIGFTGVTLGTASLLEKVRADARKKAGGDQPQVVVIEAPAEEKKGKRQKNDTLQAVHMMAQSHPANYMMTQQASDTSGVEKLAANPFPGLVQKMRANPFVQDLAGHGAERKRLLDRVNGNGYEREVLESAGDDAIEAASAPFRRIHGDDKAREKGVSGLADALKREDQAAHDALYDRMAKARLLTGGTGLAGAGAIGLMARDKEGRR